VPSSSGRPTAYRSPVSTDRGDGRSASGGGGTARTSARQVSDTANVARSIAYTQPSPTLAMSTPASAGPPSEATCIRSELSALAAGISSGVTMRGVRLSSAGRATPSIAVVNPATT
jgi:hypothetical protein